MNTQAFLVVEGERGAVDRLAVLDALPYQREKILY